jgi:hypothetical protein
MYCSPAEFCGEARAHAQQLRSYSTVEIPRTEKGVDLEPQLSAQLAF